MAVTEDEILSQAARIRAGRRRRVTKQCEVCGTAFEGLVQRRFCSDRCRMRAARAQSAAPAVKRVLLPGQREGESWRSFFMRTRAEEIARGELEGDPETLTPWQEEQLVAMEQIFRRQEAFLNEHGPVEDSTELIRASRVERTAAVMRAAGILSRHDPIWWEVASLTTEHFGRVRDAIFGDRRIEDDSTELLRQSRDAQSEQLTHP